MKQELLAEVLALPIAERIHLVEVLRDSIEAAEAWPVDECQRRELDIRLAEFNSDPKAGATVDEILGRIHRSPRD